MSDLKKMKEVFDNQAKKGIKSGDWPRLEYTEKQEERYINLRLGKLEVGFAFSLEGRLIGAYNWKE